jgi:dihydropteroate synthase
VVGALRNAGQGGEPRDRQLDQRLEGSLAVDVVAVLKGASIVRIHQVQATVRVVRMTETILGRRPPAATRRGLA